MFKKIKEIKIYDPKINIKNFKYDIDKRTKLALLGVAIGDIIGSKYEGVEFDKDPETIPLFETGHHITDDTILSIATIDTVNEIKENNIKKEKDIINVFTKNYRNLAKEYPRAGYGGRFITWMYDESLGPYNSLGDGSAMRASVIGAMFDNVKDVIKYSYYSALPTHNHPEGIKGAIVSAVITYMAFAGCNKNTIMKYLQKFYNENRINGFTTFDNLLELDKKFKTLDITCMIAVPEAFINFLYSNNFEDCMRNSMRYLCDRDTVAAISGPAAIAFYNNINIDNIDAEIIKEKYIPDKLKKYF